MVSGVILIDRLDSQLCSSVSLMICHNVWAFSEVHQWLPWLMREVNGHGCGQVAEEDLKRVASATGGAVQSTVNNLDPKVLGTCAQFEEVQVRLKSSGGHACKASQSAVDHDLISLCFACPV